MARRPHPGLLRPGGDTHTYAGWPVSTLPTGPQAAPADEAACRRPASAPRRRRSPRFPSGPRPRPPLTATLNPPDLRTAQPPPAVLGKPAISGGRSGTGRGGRGGGSGRGRRRPPPPFGARFLRRGAAAASCSSPRRVGRAALPWLPWRPFQTRQPAAGGNVWGSLPPLARPGPRAGVKQGGQRPAGLRWPWRPPCWAPAKRGGGLLLSLRCKRAVFFLGRRFCSLPSPSPGEKACSGLLSP